MIGGPRVACARMRALDYGFVQRRDRGRALLGIGTLAVLAVSAGAVASNIAAAPG